MTISTEGAHPHGAILEWSAYTLASLIIAAIILQLLLVGLNVFTQPVWWSLHIAVGHFTGVLFLLLAVTAWVTRAAPPPRWLSLGLVILYGFQYNVFALARLVHLPYLSALHAVNALALFWGAITMARWLRPKVHVTTPSVRSTREAATVVADRR